MLKHMAFDFCVISKVIHIMMALMENFFVRSLLPRHIGKQIYHFAFLLLVCQSTFTSVFIHDVSLKSTLLSTATYCSKVLVMIGIHYFVRLMLPATKCNSITEHTVSDKRW